MGSMYKRVGLNLHYFKDRKIIDYIEAEKERTNLSYSDILRLLIVDVIDTEGQPTPPPKEIQVKSQDTNKKPKFKFEG